MTLLVRPLPFTVTTSDAIATNPALNLAIDKPGLTFKNADTSPASPTIRIDLGTAAVQYDTIALIGTNLVASDQVNIRLSKTAGSPYASNVTQPAFTGTVPEGTTAKCIRRLGATYTNRYVDIYITSAAPVEIQRLVIGKALPIGPLSGVDLGAELTFVDPSPSSSGPGWETFEELPTVPQWKVTMSFIEGADFASEWFSFLSRVGRKKGFLFVPQTDDPTKWQTEAIFGRIRSDATGTVQSSQTQKVELTIRALAP